MVPKNKFLWFQFNCYLLRLTLIAYVKKLLVGLICLPVRAKLTQGPGLMRCFIQLCVIRGKSTTQLLIIYSYPANNFNAMGKSSLMDLLVLDI